MAKSDKVAAVAELVERFRAADAVLLTEYRGLTVGQLKQLRRGLGENATYAVAKNTLARLAAKEVGLDFLAEDLKGPTAIAFVSGEPVEAAKALRDFAKDNPRPRAEVRRDGRRSPERRGCQEACRSRVPRGPAGQGRRRPQGQDWSGGVRIQRSARQGSAHHRCSAREAERSGLTRQAMFHAAIRAA